MTEHRTGEQGRKLRPAAFTGHRLFFRGYSIEAMNSLASAMAFSPDGRQVAAAGESGIIRVWNVASGKLVHELRGHAKPLRCLAFHPQGEFLLERPLLSARSEEACALGAAVFGAVVGGAQPDALTAQRAMTGVKGTVYEPRTDNVAVYRRLFDCYLRIHDAFGLPDRDARLGDVMKQLLAVRDGA